MSLRELVVLPVEVELLARCGDELCELDGCEEEADEAESDEVAASSIAEKLSVYCEGSDRLAFGALPWNAVLAGMSDETLNTLEPFAMNSQPSNFSKERAKREGAVFHNDNSWLAVEIRN